MKRRELEKALLVLETTPVLLTKLDGVSPALARQMRVEGVSLCDRMWALALLEKDFWNHSIRRLLSEDSPWLEEIGEPEVFRRAAAVAGDHREALRVFGVFRGQNVRLLRQISGDDWDRAGSFAPDRPIRLREIPPAMAKMDKRHQLRLLQAVPSAEANRAPGPSVLAGSCV